MIKQFIALLALFAFTISFALADPVETLVWSRRQAFSTTQSCLLVEANGATAATDCAEFNVGYINRYAAVRLQTTNDVTCCFTNDASNVVYAASGTIAASAGTLCVTLDETTPVVVQPTFPNFNSGGYYATLTTGLGLCQTVNTSAKESTYPVCVDNTDCPNTDCVTSAASQSDLSKANPGLLLSCESLSGSVNVTATKIRFLP